MEWFLRFEHVMLGYILVLLVIILFFLRMRKKSGVTYRHSLALVCAANNMGTRHPFKKIFTLIRLCVCIVLALIVAKPQLVDSRSQMPVEGIDIVVVLDVSGSMQFQDYADDERSRFDVAKAEAIRFIEKRDHDAIGLVIFGRDALSRCPITHDKSLLQAMVNDLNIGFVDPDGTVLVRAMLTAINRLKSSKAKSKVMIVLTDGEPSEHDVDPSLAIEAAKQLGIKIYTIGIGSEQEQLFMHPLYGLVPKPKVNKQLLTMIADKTSGRYFLAHDARDMRAVYDTIDQLERTEHDVPVYSRYQDIYMPLLLGAVILLLGEWWLAAYQWFAL